MISIFLAEGGQWVWPETQRPSSVDSSHARRMDDAVVIYQQALVDCGVSVLALHRPTRPGGRFILARFGSGGLSATNYLLGGSG